MTPATIAILILVGIAAALDVRYRRIPNWLTAGIAAAGLLAALVLPGWLTIGQAAAGLGIGLLVPFVLFAMGLLGAGDAKLLAAIGAWVGPLGIVWVILLTGVAGGVLAIVASAMQGQLRVMLRNTWLIVLGLLLTRRIQWVSATAVARSEEKARRVTVPYAVAILAGLAGTQLMMGMGVL